MDDRQLFLSEKEKESKRKDRPTSFRIASHPMTTEYILQVALDRITGRCTIASLRFRISVEAAIAAVPLERIGDDWLNQASVMFMQFLHCGGDWWLWSDGSNDELAVLLGHLVQETVGIGGGEGRIATVELFLDGDGAVAAACQSVEVGVFFWCSRAAGAPSSSHNASTLLHAQGHQELSYQLNGLLHQRRISTIVVGDEQWPHVRAFVEHLCRDVNVSREPNEKVNVFQDDEGLCREEVILLVVPTWTPSLVVSNGIQITRGVVIANVTVFAEPCSCASLRARVSLLAVLLRSNSSSNSSAMCRADALRALCANTKGEQHVNSLRREYLRQDQMSLLSPTTPAGEQRSRRQTSVATVVDEFAERLDSLECLSTAGKTAASGEENAPLGSLVNASWSFNSSSVPLDDRVLALHVDFAVETRVIGRVGHHRDADREEDTLNYRELAVPVSLLVLVEQESLSNVNHHDPLATTTTTLLLDEQSLLVPLKCVVPAVDSVHPSPSWSRTFHHVVLVDLLDVALSTLRGVQKLMSRVSCLLVVDPDCVVPVMHHVVESTGVVDAVSRARSLHRCRSYSPVSPRRALLEAILWNAPHSNDDHRPAPSEGVDDLAKSVATTSILLKMGLTDDRALREGCCSLMKRSTATSSRELDSIITCGVVPADTLSGMTTVAAQSPWFPHVAFLRCARLAVTSTLSHDEEQLVHWLAYDVADEPHLAPCFRRQLLRLRSVEEIWSSQITL